MIFSLRSALVSLSTTTFFTNAQSSNAVIYTRIPSFSHYFYTGFIIHQTHSKFVSLGKTKPIRQSEGFGAIDNIEQVSGEYGRMKSILVHIDLNAGILITPAQSRCWRYIIKSWNCTRKMRNVQTIENFQVKYFAKRSWILHYQRAVCTAFH